MSRGIPTATKLHVRPVKMQISQLIFDPFYGKVKFDPIGKKLYKITVQRLFFKLAPFGHSDKMFHLTLKLCPQG